MADGTETATPRSRGLRAGSLSMWEAVGSGAVLVLVLPGLSTRVGRGLSQHEGLADSSAGE